MKNNLDIQPHHLAIVIEILRKHFTSPTTIWVFGSRARNTAKKFSDLDLLIQFKNPISIETMADLNYDFEESGLPYKVDIVDCAAIDDGFYKNIKDDKRLLLKI